MTTSIDHLNDEAAIARQQSAILARVATLCDNSTSPYRGQGELPVPGVPATKIRVQFENTTAGQQIKLETTPTLTSN